MTNPTIPLLAYLGATHFAPFIAKRHLRKRVAAGKEHDTRWTEKLGISSLSRPDGRLIWMHAVGLGEVLSLRGLIAAMAPLTDTHFLITSSTLAGANVMSKNLPPRTIHQFLPLDAPPYRRKFLDHWKPDLCIWAEQDLWPGFVQTLVKRGTPQAMVATRITDESLRKKWRLRSTFSHLYNRMALITAYDQASAGHLNSFGQVDVSVTGSLKPTAPALQHDPAELTQLGTVFKDRFIWITAPSHSADETIAIAAHKLLRADRPDALLIIAPRFPDRTIEPDLPTVMRSMGQVPSEDDAVYIADTFGDLGLFYRLASAALIGGTHDDTQGHSPWEAAILKTAILHGPNVANFKEDYTSLQDSGAAVKIETPEQLSQVLTQDMSPLVARASAVVAAHRSKTDQLARDLLALI